MTGITSMTSMFQGATKFNQDLTAWIFTNPQKNGNRITLQNMFTGSGIPPTASALVSMVNHKIYNAWINKYFTQTELNHAGLTTSASIVPHKPEPASISYSFNNGQFMMHDASGAVINAPIKLSLNFDLNISS